MSLKLATALLVAAAFTTSPALACMGSTVLVSENFQKPDAAWGAATGTIVTIAGGYLQITPGQGDWAVSAYGGKYLDSADACIDVLSPATIDPSGAAVGLVFGADSTGFFMFQFSEDGSASVARYSRAGDGAFAYPVPSANAKTLKPGPNVSNTLRVTWNAGKGAAYINGQIFSPFVIAQPLQNTLMGLFTVGDASATAGATWKFNNLKVTNVAP